MKKIITTIVFSFLIVSMFAQSTEAPQKLKYITQAPDGSVAMTIYDDSSEATMKLESASTFYKYQILDAKTNEQILSAKNTGKVGLIDKNMVAAGTYKLRIYTNKFVITSEIKVSNINAMTKTACLETVAMN